MLTAAIALAAIIGIATLIYAVKNADRGSEDAEGFHAEGNAEAGPEARPAKAFRGKKAY
ncbi:MAG TPA: hypothetical protein VGG34_12960 [Opitutaceae bacterium]|jgi:hypothetical protein